MNASLRPRYLMDSSALIKLVSPRDAQARPRDLSKLLREGRLRIPDGVGREVARGDDRLKRWVAANPSCIQPATDVNVSELLRITRNYKELFGPSVLGADPLVVAMGLYYRGSWTVVANDAGVQAACFREGLAYLTSEALLRIEELGRYRVKQATFDI